METWRVVATGAFIVGGLVLVLVGMAQVRDRVRRRSERDAKHAQVLRAALVGLVAVAAVALLIALWLPSTVAWALVAATALAIVFLTTAD
ncbi:hypothetical protein KCV87_19325 [Actinosynnema pretiosum subsp. pretiosum]|uniref:Integral membrane protein n=3 Tax=Actinosynnema TaxID=40566 RepID=C6WF76_ACTMD|nr:MULTISPECIES: hypothetical protein [Actinosynnema]ACU34208.1 hypothetical protein Amir_0239 [Actinosynnema mirum DSM 43827]ATE52060.1 hypothetical protein CNX65_01130 [Actinosynnema pretiosum]AXX27580.1 hypothetical protein APASM_0215 [Actinosynnema pretiosum subsp. pretiosum]QUF01710.1 hypothetical protein KCV87_19325 [Actinosynnema pretiosum subsp. pretiosum]